MYAATPACRSPRAAQHGSSLRTRMSGVYAATRISLLLIAALAAAPLVASPAAVLHRGNGVEPESLDPHQARSESALMVLRDLYEGLVTTAPDGALEPGQAERWEQSADGLTWTFHLRVTARWSDGTPVTAEDFAFAFRRLADPATGAAYARHLAVLRGAEAVLAGRAPPSTLGVAVRSPRTLVLTLTAPAPQLPALLTHPAAVPLPQAAIARDPQRFTRPGRSPSNGAFLLAAWQPHEVIALERNPRYWNDSATRLAGVRWYPIEDANAELQRYRAGALDATQTVAHRALPLLRRERPDELRVAPLLATYFYAFNLAQPPFRDAPALRQALSLAIDREVLAGKIMGSGERAAWTLVPPGTAGYAPPLPAAAGWSAAQRLAEARRLYALAGYSQQRPLRLELRHNTSDIHKRLASVVAQMWKQALGIETSIVNSEWRVFVQDRRAGRITQVYRSGWNGDYDDPLTFLEVGRVGHPVNDFGFADPAFDAALAAAAAERDPARRATLLATAERRLLEQQPILPLYHYVSKHLVAPRVVGWTDNLLDVHLSRQLALR